MMIHIVPLITDRGVSIVEAGVIAGLIGVGSIIGRIGAGFVSDKAGGKKVLAIALTIQLAAMVWLLFSRDTWMLYIFVLLFGLGSGGWAALMAAFPANYFGLKDTGAILGFAIILAGVGAAIGPYFGGYIFDMTQSYDYLIVLCIIVCVASVISSAFILPLKSKKQASLIH